MENHQINSNFIESKDKKFYKIGSFASKQNENLKINSKVRNKLSNFSTHMNSKDEEYLSIMSNFKIESFSSLDSNIDDLQEEISELNENDYDSNHCKIVINFMDKKCCNSQLDDLNNKINQSVDYSFDEDENFDNSAGKEKSNNEEVYNYKSNTTTKTYLTVLSPNFQLKQINNFKTKPFFIGK